MKQVSLILEPGQIGSMKLKNRFVMAAMGHGFCDETDGYVSDRLIEFFGFVSIVGVELSKK